MLSPMPLAFVALHLALLALAVALPVATARARPRVARALLGAGVLVLLPLQLAVASWPELLAASGWADVLFVSEHYVALALLVATAGLLAQPAGRARARTGLLALPLVVAAVCATTLPLRAPSLDLLSAEPRLSADVVMQSTDVSCAAAAAATLVRALGVDPTATERDLARLCLTDPARGTSDLGLYRGLSLACAPRRVRFARLDPAQARALGRPCLIFVGLDPARVDEPLRTELRDQAGWDEGVAHAVVLFGVDHLSAQIGEPKIGRERWPLRDLEALWDGRALLVE
jgi:hypothetical protein